MEADKEVIEKADSKLSEGNRIWIPVFEKLKNESKRVKVLLIRLVKTFHQVLFQNHLHLTQVN